MPMLHSNTADAFTPEDYGKAVDLAVKANSVTARTDGCRHRQGEDQLPDLDR